MARKASDLLDVFRLRPEPSGGKSAGDKKPARTSRGGTSKSGAKRTKTTASRKPAKARKRPDDVVALSRRQLVYAGSVVFLLMALSFTFGVSMSGDDSTSNNALRRDVPVAWDWYIEGYMDQEAILTGKRIDIQAAGRALQDYGVKHEMLRARLIDGKYRIRIGPFPTRQEAFMYADSYALTAFVYGTLSPFGRMTFVRVKPKRRP